MNSLRTSEITDEVNSTTSSHSARLILSLISLSGFTSLCWEVIWQLKATLTFGISAWGTALTLAIMMGGMGLGAHLIGNRLNHHHDINPIRAYGILELAIGLSGLTLLPAFFFMEKIDTLVYAYFPGMISQVYLLGIILIMGLPALCMGATFPLFKLIAKQLNIPISTLYRLNTAGSAASILITAMLIIPVLGISQAIWLIAGINICIFILTRLIAPTLISSHVRANSLSHDISSNNTLSFNMSKLLVFVTSFAIFTLEVAWTRSLTNIYPTTTDNFAIILACTLIALSKAAHDASNKKNICSLPNKQMITGGILILLITPLIERLDIMLAYEKLIQQSSVLSTNSASALAEISHFNPLLNPDNFKLNAAAVFIYLLYLLLRFGFMYALIVPPIRALGYVFPSLINQHHSPQEMAKLYVTSTIAAMAGSISAAWLLLPVIGIAKTSWLTGVLAILVGLIITNGFRRIIWLILALLALLVAIYFESDIGKSRAQGLHASDANGEFAKILAYHEGPDATVAAIEYNDKSRALLINSIAAAWESGRKIRQSIHYMPMMGHLPMLAHPNPRSALVICFGTGQTANAVRKNNPDVLDIVDINNAVFKSAHYFRSNENVLNDARVNKIVMDGRAYLRRTQKKYDIITLEPMPPNAAGVNAMYSREFYLAAKSKLTADGIIAQWLPFHIVSPYYTASITRTFIDVFPNAILWLDQASKTGILLGSKNTAFQLGIDWPGLNRGHYKYDLSELTIRQSVILNKTTLAAYSKFGAIITDDNQMLSYGKSLINTGNTLDLNYLLLKHINPHIPDSQIGNDFS